MGHVRAVEGDSLWVSIMRTRGITLAALALALAASFFWAASRAAQHSASGRLVSVPWSLISVDGRRVRILVEDEGCNYVLAHTRVAQTPRRVRIAVEEHVYPLPRGVACPAVARAIRVTIRLRGPLGRRALVHARVTPGLPLG